MAVALADHLRKQDYAPDQVTILVLYVGQLFAVKFTAAHLNLESPGYDEIHP